VHIAEEEQFVVEGEDHIAEGVALEGENLVHVEVGDLHWLLVLDADPHQFRIPGDEQYPKAVISCIFHHVPSTVKLWIFWPFSVEKELSLRFKWISVPV
jgi:hypothetical protein